MGSSHRLDIVDVLELVDSRVWEQIPCSPVADGPGAQGTVWIRPYEIAHGTRFRDFSHPVDKTNAVNERDIWRKAAMQTKNLF